MTRQPWWDQEGLPLEGVSPDPPARTLGDGDRFYCPNCGEVRRTWTILSGALVVESHWRPNVERDTWVQCPGGAVDKRKDRAP